MTLKRRTAMMSPRRHRTDTPSALEVEGSMLTFHSIRPDGSFGGDRYEPFPTGYTLLSGPTPESSLNKVGSYRVTFRGILAEIRALFRPYEPDY